LRGPAQPNQLAPFCEVRAEDEAMKEPSLLDILQGPAGPGQTHLRQIWSQDTQAATAAILACLPALEGPTLLRLLEWLADLDGAIAPFLEGILARILAERSAMQAKGLLVIYSYFNSHEAYDHLEAQRSRFSWDLQAACRQALDRLKNRFLDQFLLKDLRSQLRDPLRLRNIAQNMRNYPSPAYGAFLKEALRSGEEEDLALLSSLFEDWADEELFNLLLQRLRRDMAALASWCSWADFALGTTPSWPNISIGSVWKGPESFRHLVEQDRLQEALGCLRQLFPWPKSWWSALTPSLCDRLREKSPSRPAELRQFRRKLEASPSTALLALARSAGSLGARFQHQGLVAEFQQLLHEHPWSRPVLLTLMSGYQSDAGKDLLLQWLDEEADLTVLKHICGQLAQNALPQVPPRIWRFLQEPECEALREDALHIIARSAEAPRLLPLLRDWPEEQAHKLARLMGECPIPGGAEALEQALARPNTSPAWKETVLEALHNLHHPGLARLAEAFLQEQSPYLVWFSALKCLMYAGPGWQNRLRARLTTCSSEKQAEILCSCLSILGNDLSPLGPAQAGLCKGDWAIFLEHPGEKVRMSALKLLLNQNPLEFSQLDQWLGTLDVLAGKGEEKGEQGSLARKLQLLIRQAGQAEAPQNLTEIMDGFWTVNDFHRARWLRAVSIGWRHYSRELATLDQAVVAAWLQECARYFQHDPLLLHHVVELMGLTKIQSCVDYLQTLAMDQEHPLQVEAQTALRRSTGDSEASIRVLLVDDCKLMGRSLERVLKKSEFEARFIPQPEEVAQVCREFEPAILVSDYLLGATSGVRLARALQNEGLLPEKLLFITSSRDPDDHSSIKIAFPQATILLKPFSVVVFLERLRQLAERSKLT
jgi:CheY-like chemotaxis protein